MLACLLIPTAAVLAARQTPFRGRTDLVSVYATVTDKDGHIVTNLTKDDFEIRDEGKVQRMEFFSNDLQPIKELEDGRCQ